MYYYQIATPMTLMRDYKVVTYLQAISTVRPTTTKTRAREPATMMATRELSMGATRETEALSATREQVLHWHNGVPT